MTQEEKELLLKDICTRLPYGIVCDCMHGKNVKATMVDVEDFTIYYTDCDEWESIEYCKPYLRPMSSMTEEERTELKSIITEDLSEFAGDIRNGHGLSLDGQYAFHSIRTVDWLNRKMFDFRELIEKGLAIGATEKNNPYE